MKLLIRHWGFASLLALPWPAHAARTLSVNFGTGFSLWGLFANVIGFLAASIGSIAVALFIVGALMITVSGVKEDYKQRGKDLIFGSLISLAVVLGAYAFLRTINYVLS